jgi:hypothetical protein
VLRGPTFCIPIWLAAELEITLDTAVELGAILEATLELLTELVLATELETPTLETRLELDTDALLNVLDDELSDPPHATIVKHAAAKTTGLHCCNLTKIMDLLRKSSMVKNSED